MVSIPFFRLSPRRRPSAPSPALSPATQPSCSPSRVHEATRAAARNRNAKAQGRKATQRSTVAFLG
eukprot:scaffold233864_cov27-Tisochrysis_lutea.AAC.1